MIHIHDYTDKSIAVLGDTKPHSKQLKSLGGRYNPHLTVDGEKVIGWIFKSGDRSKVQKYIESGGKTLEDKLNEFEERLAKLESCLSQE